MKSGALDMVSNGGRIVVFFEKGHQLIVRLVPGLSGDTRFLSRAHVTGPIMAKNADFFLAASSMPLAAKKMVHAF